MIRAAVAALTIALLAACSSGGTTEVAQTARAKVDAAAFLPKYKKAFPLLALDRSDKGLTNDITGLCNYFLTSESEAQTIRYAQGRFAAHDGTYASKAEAQAIIKLARSVACPA